MTPFSFADRARAWLPLLPLLLLMAGTWWLNHQVQPLPQVQSQQRHDIDYAIDNFAAVTLNAQGMPRYTLSAERMWHYPDDDTTHLQQPRIETLYTGHPPTLTVARTGMVSRHADEVFLYNDISITRPATATAPEAKFTTEYLHFIPDRDWAETNQPVTFVNPFNVIHAVGMELDNKNHTARLLSHVKAVHEPIPH